MKSADEVLRFFAARIVADPKILSSLGGSCTFVLTDSDKAWTLRGGDLHADKRDGACTLMLTEKDFVAIGNGSANPQALFNAGRLAVEGDTDAALKLVHLW